LEQQWHQEAKNSMANVKVLLLSILGLLFIVLTFVWNPWFIAGAIIIMLINQRELMKNSSKKSKK
jgi:asparagine N-glycosylation enzyme membrane subunit Stt3